MVVVSDDMDTIAMEVKAASPVNDFVLTTGGIGPTHDDVTMEGMGCELIPLVVIPQFFFISHFLYFLLVAISLL